MTYETLKRSHLKRNILIAVVIVFILSAIILTFTKAKYRTTESMPLLNGTINYTLADLNIVEMYLNGEAIDALPDGNYELTEESYCTNEKNVKDESITLSYDGSTKAFTVTPFNKKGIKCYLYFDEKDICEGLTASECILTYEGGAATVEAKGTPDFNKTAQADCSEKSNCEETNGMYAAEDDYGTTYYYRGAVNDNWFQFGTNSSGQPLYWRIVRINGDGSIRLIYNGTNTATTGDSTMINTSQAFNTSSSNNAYVGYMYKSEEVHGLVESSDIKKELDEWYSNNLSKNADKIDGNAGFCGDRTSTTTYGEAPNNTGGTGTTTTYYGAQYRLYINKIPTFKCTYEDASGVKQDLYTTNGSSKGNGKLTYPIGLITADEVAFAGGVYSERNRSYYLYTNTYYWTMSPHSFGSSTAYVFTVNSNGNLNYTYVTSTNDVRPVINLKSAIAISGEGSTDKPFKLSVE